MTGGCMQLIECTPSSPCFCSFSIFVLFPNLSYLQTHSLQKKLNLTLFEGEHFYPTSQINFFFWCIRKLLYFSFSLLLVYRKKEKPRCYILLELFDLWCRQNSSQSGIRLSETLAICLTQSLRVTALFFSSHAMSNVSTC